jgi:membrane protein DedA with SNARE-associated domain
MERVLSHIEHYGYLVVFFRVMLESTGVLLPGVLAQRGHLWPKRGDT